MIIALDIGGTFTDTVLIDSITGEIWKVKSLTTPKNLSKCFADGISKVCQSANVKEKKINYIIHGSTVSTNAVVAQEGAKLALITTKGFRDVLEIGRTKRYDLYDLFYKKPVPLIPRHLRVGIPERIDCKGEELIKVDKKDVKRVLKKIDESVECICVCLLNSYTNPTHEKEIEEIIKKENPDVFLSCSYDVMPIFREYERLSTTVLNGYVAPVTIRYAGEIIEITKKGLPEPFIVTGSGGIITLDLVKKRPGETFLSGPAGGVAGAAFIGQILDYKDIITFDMGGTSCDVALIDAGEPVLKTESYVGGYPFYFPTIYINTIAAGGGSIAWIDNGGILRVGPKSAGADPGPVCYNMGGTNPTVTDADLILRRYNPDYFLGGEMKLNPDLAEKIIKEKIAEPLGIDVTEAASGIIEIANAKMIDAIKVVSINEGYNPSDFVLVSFGGAGSSHIAFMMDELKIPTVVCSPLASVFSAFGMLSIPIKYNLVFSKIIKDPYSKVGYILDIYERLRTKGERELKRTNIQFEDMEFLMSVDMRYRGQRFDTNIPVFKNDLEKKDIKTIIDRFHELHEKKYTYSQPEMSVEMTTFRLSAIAKLPKIKLKKIPKTGRSVNETIKTKRNVILDRQEEECFIYDGKLLDPEHRIEGPAIIEYTDTTIVIPHSKRGIVDDYGNVIISKRR